MQGGLDLMNFERILLTRLRAARTMNYKQCYFLGWTVQPKKLLRVKNGNHLNRVY